MANWPRLPLGVCEFKLPHKRRPKSDVLQAGLFAGILAAFLIESRKDLQEDPQQSLLRDILHTLRNDSDVSTSSGFHPSTSSLFVNYAWFISLTFTLVSALSGVLAKAWLAKYAPASPGVSSSDACERHLRATRAHQWHFGALIGGIPLLIQLSLFLFFAGLVPFIYDNNRGISYTVLVLIILTVTIYLFATILPWFSPACPFQTTISDFIPGVTGKARYKEDRASSYDAGTASSGQDLSFWNAILQFAAEVCSEFSIY
jgi:CBS domain containing-hemolysin-like protein